MLKKDYYIWESLYHARLLPSNRGVLKSGPKMDIFIHQAIISKTEQFERK